MSPGGLKGEEAFVSVSMESWEGEVALEVEGESSRDSELPLTFIHSMTVVPVAVLEPDRDLYGSFFQSPSCQWFWKVSSVSASLSGAWISRLGGPSGPPWLNSCSLTLGLYKQDEPGRRKSAWKSV